MAEFAWSDGRHLTEAEERVIRELADGAPGPWVATKRSAVNHLIALKVVAPPDPPLPMRLTGLGRHIAANYLGLEIAEGPANCPLVTGLRPCECDLPRCPVCNYTEHDARFEGDHHLCRGVIPAAGGGALTAFAGVPCRVCGVTRAEHAPVDRSHHNYVLDEAALEAVAVGLATMLRAAIECEGDADDFGSVAERAEAALARARALGIAAPAGEASEVGQ